MINMSQMGRKRKPLTQLSIEEASTSRKKTKVPENEETVTCQRRAGTINFIILKNFMCHSLLEVNFTSNISMVIGKNGSGKSAILTALIVGLGGKASLTNRGSSVKGFVKAGKSSGTIEIQLYNEGPMAYRPRVYGKTITIIRNLSASGSGSYRVKSAAGEVISTQAREVQNITASLNIQVDNPICILNQDTSRNFLSSNDPKNKFTLFMRATKLETLEAEYKKIQNNKRESVRIIEDKEKSFRQLQEEIKRLKRKIDGHKSIVNLKDRKQLLHKELLWARVRDSEKELEQERAKVEKYEKKLNDFKGNSDKRVEEVNVIKQNIKDLERNITELKEQIHIQSRPQLDLRRTLDELQGQYTAKKREKQSILTTIESKTKDKDYLETEITNANENMSKVEQQKTQRMRDLASMQDKLKGMDDRLETSKNELFQIKNDLSRKQDEEQNLLKEINQVDQRIYNEKNSLNAMKKESGNELLLYGPNMPRVKEMIQKYKNKFQHEPRGPLGSYIKLKDKKWAVAVEGFIGPSTLSAFTVDNKKDNQLLRDIFNKTWQGGSQPAIITSKFVYRKHDVSRNLVKAPSDCVSLYDAIGIDDVIVSNSIVDQSSPENILLIPNNERAIELLAEQNLVPRNCSQGLTIKGDKFYPDPNYRTYASRYHKAQYLQIDTKEHIQSLEQNINSLMKNKQAIQSQLQALRRDMQEQTNQKNELEEKIRKVNFAKSQIRRQYEDLNNAAEPEVQNVHYLEQELEEIKKTLNEKNGLVGKILEEMKELKMKCVEVDQKMSKLKDSTKGLEERIPSLQEQIRENQAKQREFETNYDFDKRRLKEHEKRLNEARSEMVLKQNTVKNHTDEASALGERLPDLRDIPDISTEIKEIERSISRIETDTDNIGDVVERFTELHEKYKAASDMMKNLNKDVQELSVAVDRRNRHYKLTESYFITFMKHSFKKILEFRQFKGTIDIKMNEKKLELIVIPQHGSQGVTTTSNLSGGERSFSTVAFLYALWQCMEFPFYFLDEFDVYMDKLNRTKVIDILLHHANSRPLLQFVFLTPQDVSFINKDVSVLRLADPERFNL